MPKVTAAQRDKFFEGIEVAGMPVDVAAAHADIPDAWIARRADDPKFIAAVDRAQRKFEASSHVVIAAGGKGSRGRAYLLRQPTKGTRHGNGPASGAGWGGPAKGSDPRERHVLEGPGPGPGHYTAKGEERADRVARHAEEMQQLYYEFAHNDEKEDATRLSAATHLLNRIQGLPVAKIVTAVEDDF